MGSEGIIGKSAIICLHVLKNIIPGNSVSSSTFNSSCILFFPATLAPAHGNSARGRQPYYVQQTIDLTANSIAHGDVVQALTIPANTKIIAVIINIFTQIDDLLYAFNNFL